MGVNMKKILGVISIFIVLLLVYQNNNILGSIKLYEKLHNPSYVEYVHCDDILNRAVSKNENYESVSKYMSEEIYNNLSIKTKSFYEPNQKWNQKIYVINQIKDLTDDKIIYVDFILYDDQNELVKYVSTGRVSILKDGVNWKIIDYIQSTKPLPDDYIGTVYNFILP